MMRPLLRLLCLVLLGVACTPLRAADLTVTANSHFLIDAWINSHPGLIGPADMPYDQVVFELARDRGGEGETVLPMQFPSGEGLYYPLIAGEQEIPVQFSLIKPASMATGAAGALLSSLNGGGWTGDAREVPIEFGVVRPVRPLALQRPLSLEGLELSRFLVRTGDHRGNLELPPEPNADPDEIVVTGAGGKRQRARYGLTVGLDRLSTCSRLVWNNLTRQLTLRCAPAGPAG